MPFNNDLQIETPAVTARKKRGRVLNMRYSAYFGVHGMAVGDQCTTPMCGGKLYRKLPPNRADLKCNKCGKGHVWDGH